MKKLNIGGQILIVLMLALAIISILLVLISRNVRRDTLDQLQSEQYEEYYSAVEQELLKIISGESACDIETLVGCDSLALDLRSGVTNSLAIQKDDIINFSNMVVGRDKSITVPLGGYNGDLKFSWQGSVAWVVNIDYLNSSGEYKTSQSIYDNFNIFPNNPIHCVTNFFTSIGTNSFSFNIDDCLSSLSSPYTALSVRMKPIMRGSDSTELSLLEPTSGLPPQARIIRATADINDDLGSSPSIQLELQVPTTSPSLEILDYALRTNKIVYKVQY